MSDESQENEETTESIKRQTEARQEGNKEKRSESDLLKEFLDLKKKDNELSSRRAILDMEYLARIGKKNSARKEAMALLKELENQNSSYMLSNARITELQEKGANATAEEAAELNKLTKELDNTSHSMDENAAAIRKVTQHLKELGEIGNKDQKTVERLTGGFESMTFGLIKANDAQNHMITGFGKMIGELSRSANKLQVLTESFTEVFNVANIAAAALNTITRSTMGMAKAFDTAGAQFSKTTGLAREYSDVLYSVQRQGNQFGVTAAEGGQAMAGLMANFSEFHKTAPAVQKDLTLNVAQLTKFGVSAGESADIMQIFTKTMNMSGKESVEMTKKIGMMGTQIGITTGKMLKDYKSSLKTLAVYGDKSIDVFTGIAAAAKAAGVATGTLLGLAEKFDTFSGAADTTGKLNAILGSQLSATEMLMMKEDERIKTLISTTQATGQAFSSMDRFTQKAIANAAGITDMAEANKIFGMSMSEYESYEMQMKQSSKTQERFESALKSMTPLLEKLSLLANEFAAVFVPILTVTTTIIETLISVMRYLDEESGGLFTTILGGVAAFVLLYKALGVVSLGLSKNLILGAKQRIMSMFTKKDKIVETTLTTQQAAAEIRLQAVQRSKMKTQMLATAATRSAVGPMLALGAAVLMIGGGIGLAALGMAEFVKAFAGLTGEQLLAATVGIVAFTIAFAVLMSGLIGLVSGPQAILTAAAVAVLHAVGLAALMIGGGIAIAALGMAEFVKSMAGLEKMAGLMGALSGTADIAVDLVFSQRMGALSEFLDKVDKSDIKAELENIALITTGTSATLMTENTVTQIAQIKSLAEQIKNVFKADITIKIDGDAMDNLIANGVYKTSMGNV